MDLEMEDHRLVIQSPLYDLGKMLEEISPENCHHLLLEDKRKGNEAW